MNYKLFKRLLLISALTLTPLFQNLQAEAQLNRINTDTIINNRFKDVLILKVATISGTIDMIDDSYRSNHSTVGQCSDVEVRVEKIISASYSPGSFPVIEYKTVASIRATGDINSGYCAYTLNLFYPPKDDLYLRADYVYPVSNLSVFPTSDSQSPIRIGVGDQLIRNMQVSRPILY